MSSHLSASVGAGRLIYKIAPARSRSSGTWYETNAAKKKKKKGKIKTEVEFRFYGHNSFPDPTGCTRRDRIRQLTFILSRGSSVGMEKKIIITVIISGVLGAMTIFYFFFFVIDFARSRATDLNSYMLLCIRRRFNDKAVPSSPPTWNDRSGVPWTQTRFLPTFGRIIDNDCTGSGRETWCFRHDCYTSNRQPIFNNAMFFYASSVHRHLQETNICFRKKKSTMKNYVGWVTIVFDESLF